MVDLKPISTPNDDCNNTEKSSSSCSSSPTSPLPPNLPITLPHLLLYPPPPAHPSSTSFTLFHFQELMYSPPHFYNNYYLLPNQIPPCYFYPSPISFSLPPPLPPPPPCYGGSQLVVMNNSVVAKTHDGGVVFEPPSTPPAPAGERGFSNRKRYFQRKPKNKWIRNNGEKWIKKEWKPRQKSEHASGCGSHSFSPSLRQPPPPYSGHLANCTTLMVKNIPNFISRATMIGMLDCHCRKQNHQAAYNFLYLPFDFKQKNNLGYAFVNFTTEEGASTLGISWNGKGWSVSTKIRQITPAKVQGIEMCKKHFEDSRLYCLSEDFLPVAFSPPRNGFNGGACKMTTIGRWVNVKDYNWRSVTVIPPRLSH